MAASTSDGRPDDLPPDIDQFVAAPLETGEGEPAVIEAAGAIEDAAEPPAPEMIGPDEFWTVFETAFSLPGTLAPRFRPLAIQPEERERARAASDAIWRIASVYAPGLLRPNSQLFTDLLIAGPFLAGKVLLARDLMRRPAGAPAGASGAPPAGDGPADQFAGWPSDGGGDG